MQGRGNVNTKKRGNATPVIELRLSEALRLQKLHRVQQVEGRVFVT